LPLHLYINPSVSSPPSILLCLSPLSLLHISLFSPLFLSSSLPPLLSSVSPLYLLPSVSFPLSLSL
jgi:hypothetical protein